MEGGEAETGPIPSMKILTSLVFSGERTQKENPTVKGHIKHKYLGVGGWDTQLVFCLFTMNKNWN